MDSFVYFYKYYNIFNRILFESEWTESDNKLKEFNDSNTAIIFVRTDGLIFDVNDAFCQLFEIEEHLMYDNSC